MSQMQWTCSCLYPTTISIYPPQDVPHKMQHLQSANPDQQHHFAKSVLKLVETKCVYPPLITPSYTWLQGIMECVSATSLYERLHLNKWSDNHSWQRLVFTPLKLKCSTFHRQNQLAFIQMPNESYLALYIRQKILQFHSKGRQM